MCRVEGFGQTVRPVRDAKPSGSVGPIALYLLQPFAVRFLVFGVSDFGFWVLGFGLWGLGLGFWVCVSGF